MNPKPIILVGGGGHCRSVIEAAESARIPIAGIIDLPSERDTTVLGYPVIGCDDDIPRFIDKYRFVVTLGFIDCAERRVALHRLIEEAGGELATVVASTARVSRHATIGRGTVVLHGAVVNAGAQVGQGVIINTLADVDHDAVVGDYTHISTGAMVNGQCTVGARCFIGSNVTLFNGISVADDIIVSGGSVARKSLRAAGVYAGNPATLKIPRR